MANKEPVVNIQPAAPAVNMSQPHPQWVNLKGMFETMKRAAEDGKPCPYLFTNHNYGGINLLNAYERYYNDKESFESIFGDGITNRQIFDAPLNGVAKNY